MAESESNIAAGAMVEGLVLLIDRLVLLNAITNNL